MVITPVWRTARFDITVSRCWISQRTRGPPFITPGHLGIARVRVFDTDMQPHAHHSSLCALVRGLEPRPRWWHYRQRYNVIIFERVVPPVYVSRHFPLSSLSLHFYRPSINVIFLSLTEVAAQEVNKRNEGTRGVQHRVYIYMCVCVCGHRQRSYVTDLVTAVSSRSTRRRERVLPDQ